MQGNQWPRKQKQVCGNMLQMTVNQNRKTGHWKEGGVAVADGQGGGSNGSVVAFPEDQGSISSTHKVGQNYL